MILQLKHLLIINKFDLIVSDLLKKQDNCNSLIIFIKNYIY